MQNRILFFFLNWLPELSPHYIYVKRYRSASVCVCWDLIKNLCVCVLSIVSCDSSNSSSSSTYRRLLRWLSVFMKGVGSRHESNARALCVGSLLTICGNASAAGSLTSQLVFSYFITAIRSGHLYRCISFFFFLSFGFLYSWREKSARSNL
jgi:hypothetical protein